MELLGPPSAVAADSVIRALNVSIPRGETNRLVVVLESQGNENAIAFSLCYDTNLLSFVRAVRGVDSTNAAATLVVGTTSTNRGRVGMLLGLDVASGQVFSAGTNRIVEVLFRAAAGSGMVTTPIAFCDLPTVREVSDVDAQALPAAYVDATITLLGGCSYSLGSSQAAPSAAGGTGSVSVLTAPGCAWTASSSLPWVSILSGTSGSGNGTVLFEVQPNPGSTPRSGTLDIAGQPFLIQQAGLTCSYTLSPTNRNHGPGANSNSLAVTTDISCAWAASSTNAWITLLSPLTGMGSGAVGYQIAANPSPQERVGHIQVADQVLTIRQAGFTCAYSLSPTNRNHGSGAASNGVSVTTDAGCAWTASTSNNWITLLSPVSGTGPGSLAYQVAPNATPVERVGHIQVADQVLTIRQAGFSCVYSLSPTNRNHGAGAASNGVSVITDAACPWVASSTNNWITIVSPAAGTGPGSLGYQIAANATPVERVGHIQIADQVLTIRQAGFSCAYSLSPTNRNHGSGAATNSVGVTAEAGCPWAASTTNDWILLVAPLSGTGPGSLGYQLSANAAPGERVGYIQIADQVLTVRQAGLLCTYSLSPTNRNHGSGAVTNSVGVTAEAGCPWVASTTNDWIALVAPASGTGSGSLGYQLSANATPGERLGYIQVADQVLTVRQAGLVCTYSLSPTNRNHGSSAATNNVSVTADAGCSWSASTTNSWITLLSGLSGAGNGVVTYAVTANLSVLERVGHIQVGAETLSVRQAALVCSYSLSPTNRNHGYGAASNAFTINTGANCPWMVMTTNSWITVTSASTGTGVATVSYAITANPNPVERVGALTVGDQVITVRQAGINCSYSLSPTNRSHGTAAATNSFTVTTGPTCPWTVTNTNSWILLLSPSSGTGTGVVTYAVLENTGALDRTGLVSVAGLTLTVRQGGVVCSYAVSPLVRNHGYGAATNLITVTAAAGCAWTAVTTNDWISIQAGAAGTGNGTVSYAVAPNSGVTGRTGLVQVADAVFSVTQDPLTCTFSLSPSARVHGVAAATNTFSLAAPAGCAWTLVNTSDWVTVAGSLSGTGPASFTYVIAPNPLPLERVAVLMVGSESLTLTQRAALCAYELSPTNVTHGSGMETGVVTVLTGTNCAWSAATTNLWITLDAGASGLGDGGFGYTLGVNTSSVSRVGHITVAGQVVTLSQAGRACSYRLSPTNRTHGYAGTSNAITVAAGVDCAWTAVTTQEWITIVAGGSGTGDGTVGYLVAANPLPSERTGWVMVADQVFSLVQLGAPCTATLSPSARTHGPGPASNTVILTTLAGCPWEVVNTNAWISFAPPTSGSGSATLAYAVTENPLATERVAVVLIAGESLVVTQRAAVCSFTLSTGSRTHGFGPATNSVTLTTLAGCAWTMVNTNPWIHFTTPPTGTGSTTLAYHVDANPLTFWRTGVVVIAGESLTLAQRPAPCAYSLSISNVTSPDAGFTGQVQVVTSSNCPWEATTTNSWIQVVGVSSLPGNGILDFSVMANPTPQTRVGAIMVGDTSLVITQSGVSCSFSLTPVSRAHEAGQATGEVAVATLNLCTWSVVNTNPWISLVVATGSGPASLTYVVEANPGLTPRAGSLVIGGQPFAITQAGAPCSYRLSPTNRTHGYGATTGTVTVASADGCAWSASTVESWITVLAGASGNGTGTVTYALAPNESLTPRTGSIAVGDQVLAIVQQGVTCSFSLSPMTRTHGNGNVTNLFFINTLAACSWGVTNTNSWITLLSASTGVGSGFVQYWVLTNENTFERVGALQVGSQSLIITQRAAVCAFSLSATNGAYDHGTRTGEVVVATSTNCAWTVDNTNSWITVLTPAGNTGSGTVRFRVAVNMAPAERSGLLLIAGQPYAVTQAASPCLYSVSPLSLQHGPGATTGSVDVVVAPGCEWTVQNTNAWISLAAGVTGSGSGAVLYQVEANPATTARTGVVLVAGQSVAITQQGAACTYAVSPLSRAFTHLAGSGSLTVTTPAGCAWLAATTDPWLTVTSASTGTGQGTVSYSVAENQSGLGRTGTVSVAGQTFMVTQAGVPCAFAIVPPARSHGFGAETGTVAVTSPAGCGWTAVSTNDWITILAGAAGSSTGTVAYTVGANPTALVRSGFISIAGSVLVISQAAAPCTFSVAPTNLVGSHLPGSTTAIVTTPLGCAWGITNTNTWITLPGGLTGSNSTPVLILLATNPVTISRTGVLTIAGQRLTVIQEAAPCSFALTPAALAHGPGAETGLVSVATSSNCPWAVSNTNSWLSITAGASRTGSGTVGYSIAPNPAGLPRSGVLRIGDQFIVVSQAAAPCAYGLSASSASHGFGTATGSLTVTTLVGCAWSAVTTNAWISLAGATAGTNTGVINYALAANPNGIGRTGTVSLAGLIFTIMQAAAPCTYTLSSSGRVHDHVVETGSVDVVTLLGCPWSISNSVPWILIPGGSTRTNSGTVTYTLAANPTGLARTGVVSIAGSVYTVSQAAAPCAFALTPSTRTISYLAETGSLSLTTLVGCAWSATAGVPWLSLVGTTSGTNIGTFGYRAVSNDTALSRTGTVTVAGQTFTLLQAGAPCSFSLGSASRSHAAGTETGTVSVTTLTGCSWTAISTNPWVTVVGGGASTNTGVVTYVVSANPTALTRTGTVTVAGQAFTVVQAGAACTFAISPATRAHGFGAESNVIGVTTLVGCQWTVGTTAPWITLLGATNRTNNGSVSYLLQANPTALVRTGVVVAAGQSFAVVQDAAPCTFSLAPVNRSHGAGGETGTVSVVTLVGCPWTPVASVPWISLVGPPPASGSGTFSYAVEANPTALPRSGILSVGGQAFTVNQVGAACTYTFTPSSWTHRNVADTGRVAVASLVGCDWTVVNTNSWITLTDGVSGSDAGVFTYTVAANTGSATRSGFISVGGQSYLVSQPGGACGYRLSPTNRYHGFGAATNTISITATSGCPWNVVNTNAWVTLLSGASGTGSGTLTYAVSANRSAEARSALLNIGGEAMTITQWGTNCGLALLPVARSHGSGSETGQVALSASSSSCAWSVQNTNSWLTVQGAGAGSGSASLTYVLAANPNALPRMGVFTVGGESFTVNQAAAPCLWTLTPGSRSHPAAGATDSFSLSTLADCAWTVSNSNAWVAVLGGSGTGSGTVSYTVAPNPRALPRLAVLSVGGQAFTITQDAAACSYVLEPVGRAHGAAADAGLFSVNTLEGCPWSVVNTNTWINLSSGASGTNGGSVLYTLDANPSALSRTGVLAVGGQVFTVTQSGTACAYTLSPGSRTHGAGAETGSVSVNTAAGCSWSALNTNAWVTLTSSAGGTGPGTVTYAVQANPSVAGRTGVVTIAGRTLVLSQAGVACSYTLASESASFGRSAASGSIQITASNGCAWTASTSNSWIQITSGSGGTGSGTVTYSVSTNAGGSRAGIITVAGRSFAVAQEGSVRLVRAVPMTVTRGQTNRLFVVLESQGDENALGFSLCFDTNLLTFVRAVRGVDATNAAATMNTNLLSSTRGQLGFAFGLDIGSAQTFTAGSNVLAEVLFRAAAGAGSASTTVGLCDTPVAREVSDVQAEVLAASYAGGAVTVAVPCTFALGTNSDSIAAAGGSGSVSVLAEAGCAWTVVNPHSWIAITAGNGGSGPGTVMFTAQPNPGSQPRSAQLTIAGLNFVVTQAGVPCTYAATPTNLNHGFGSETGLVQLVTPEGCAWTVENTNLWIQIAPSATNGTGTAAIGYVVSANPSMAPRAGVVLFGGVAVTLSQSGTPCVFALTPAVQGIPAAGGTGLVSVATTPGCPWSATSTESWLTVLPGGSGTGSGSFGYRVAINYSTQSRTAAVAVAGQQFVVTQAASACGFGISPVSRSHSYPTATGTVAVTAAPGCVWEVVNTSAWVTVTSPLTNTGSATVTYVVSANPGGSPRSTSLLVAGNAFTVGQDPSPCAFAIAPTASAVGAGGATGMVSVATFGACAWNAGTSNSWISIRLPTNGVGVGSFTYVVESNSSGASRTGYVVLADQVLVVTQSGAPCSYLVSPTSRFHGAGAETNQLILTTIAGCPWTISNTLSWVTILGPTNGAGGGLIAYAVAPNPTGLTRTGNILIGGQTVSFTQAAAACTYALSQGSRSFSSADGTAAVNVVTLVGCPWMVESRDSWIEVTSALTGSGSAAVTYAVLANNTAYGRTGTVLIAGQPHVVTQAPAPCTYALSASNVLHESGMTTGTVSLLTLTGCSWSMTTTQAWIQLLSATNGIGSAVLEYALLANPSSLPRTGSVQVAGQELLVRQEGAPCLTSLASSNAALDAVGGTVSVAVTLPEGCPWAVTVTNSWILLTTASSGTGSALVGLSVQPAGTPSPRTGWVTIGGVPFEITQQGIVCTYVIAPTNQVLTSGNVTGLISVATSGGCVWSTVNTNPWIAIKSGESGTGNGLVRYTAAANPNPSPRVGYLVVGGQPHMVTQLGTPCSYTLAPTNRLHGSGSETGLVSVFTVLECSWTASTTNSWITLLSSNGAGNATFSYQIDANPTANDRVGHIRVASQTFSIIQLGAPCAISLSPTNTAHGPGTETNTIAVSVLPGCTWTVTKTNSWITILSSANGTGTGAVTYAVAANVSVAPRSGVVRVGGTPYTITQEGMFCSWTLAATNSLHGSGAETGVVSISTTNSLCPWVLTTTNSWITFPGGTNFVGSGTASFSVSANPSPVARYGTILVAGQAVSVGQAGINCSYSIFPPLRTHSYLSETSIVAVTTSNLCQWTVQNTNSWITVLGPTNFSSSINLIYIVGMNTSTNVRTGNLVIGGNVFPITQAALFFTCPSNRTVECGVPWIFDEPTITSADICSNRQSSITLISTVTNVSAACGGTYTATRIWQAVDACAGSVYCTQIVAVVDTTAPALVCQPEKVVECGAPLLFDTPSAIDTCSGANVTLRIASTVTNAVGGCGATFRVTRTWEALDACGNRSTCAQTVVFADRTPPVLTCVSNRTVECGAAWSFDTPTAVDACGGQISLRVLDTVTNAACGQTYSVTRTWEAADGCTNRSTCSQTVTVLDTVPPVFSCPPTKFVECGQAWSFDNATATDTCGSVTVTVVGTVTNTAGLCGASRQITRTWKAVDACGNTNYCSQLVRIVDTAAPVLVCLPARTVEFGAALNFDNPTVFDSCSGTNVTLRIVSTVTNTAGFCGAAFSVTRTWQALDGCSNQSASCSQTIRVLDTTAPVLVCTPNKTVNCNQAWSFDTPVATDLANGTNVTLTVVSTLTNGACGGLFTVTRTWRATDPCTNSATCSQTVTGIANVTVSGTVFYPAGPGIELPVAGASVAVTGFTNLAAVSGTNGAYSFLVNGTGSLTLTPGGGPATAPSAGVSTLDISLIRRHVLSITNLDSPYKVLAADVNGSSSVSTLDISFIRRLILAATNSLPLGLWRYVPADHAFSNPASPWGVPSNRTVTVSSGDLAGQNFVAIKLGDVNTSWQPPAPPLARFAPAEAGPTPLDGPGSLVTLGVGRQTARPGQTLTVSVTASNLSRVTSLQGTLAWDPAVLQFRGLGPVGLRGFTDGCLGTQRLEQGQLAFSWDDPDATGVTAEEGAAVFSVVFAVIGGSGTMSPLSVSDAVTPREVGVDFVAGRLGAISGQVLVVEELEPQLAVPVYAGGTFRVPLATQAGRRYVLEYTDSLPATNWTALPPVEGDGSVRVLTDPSPHAVRRFYRVRIE